MCLVNICVRWTLPHNCIHEIQWDAAQEASIKRVNLDFELC